MLTHQANVSDTAPCKTTGKGAEECGWSVALHSNRSVPLGCIPLLIGEVFTDGPLQEYPQVASLGA